MDVAFEDVLISARSLPRSDKAELARIMIKDLETSEDVDVEPLWLEEAKRRIEAVQRGEMETHDGDDVMARLRSLIK